MNKLLLAFMAMMFSTMATAAAPVVTLTSDNMIKLTEEVTDESVSRIILQLSDYKGKDVYLYINSPGGSIEAGNALIAALKASGKNVTCVVNFAASMAFSIMQSCDTRLVLESAIVMQHQAAYEAKGSVTKNKTMAELVDKLVAKLNSDDASRIGMPLADFQAKIHDEWWLFDKEIVQKHVADGQAGVRCSAELSKKREVQMIDSLFGTAVLTWSGCPLAAYPVSVKVSRKDGIELRDFHEWARGLYLDQDWKMRKEVR